MKFEYFRKYLYLIIPMICIGLWALAYLIDVNFILSEYYDFVIFYNAGRQFLNDPANLYKTQISFFYLPNYAFFLAFTVAIFPLFVARYIFYIINLAFALVSIREFNKILNIMGVNEEFLRFFILIVISNGWIIYRIFMISQSKFIVAAILFFILRRELQNKKNEKRYDLKYLLINFGLFVFAVGIYPIIILFLMVYLFQDMKFVDMLKKNNVKKYCIVILMFLFQNILLIIYPFQIFDLFNNLYNFRGGGWILFYLRDMIVDNIIYFSSYIRIVFISILITSTFILIFNKKLNIENKFGYLSFFNILFNSFTDIRTFVIFLPLILLIFVPFLKMDEKGINFIKNNKIILIGILSVVPIYFWHFADTIFRIFPFLKDSIFYYLIYLRYIILLCIYGACVLILNLKNRNLKAL